MNRFWPACCGVLVCALLAFAAQADTFQMADGTSQTGDIVSYDEGGMVLRLADDKYSDRIPWTKFSQADLQRLDKNPKIEPFIEPFIEIPESERPKKLDVRIQDVARLELPPKQSLFGALFSSPVGGLVTLLIYAANLFAAFEIAIFRARPVGLVVGVSGLAPILGPIVFLSIPTRVKAAEPEETSAEAEAVPATYAVPGQPPPRFESGTGSPYAVHAPAETSGAPPPPEIFQRGQFMFNRRFFETKFAGYFGITRRGADRDSVMTVKALRGEFVVNRITRISANDIHFEIVKGNASHEVMLPFAEIQEIELKHKDA